MPPEIAPLAELLALAAANAELRLQLAEVQDQCVELAVDAGELHAMVEGLQRQLAVAHAELDRWRNGTNAQASTGTA